MFWWQEDFSEVGPTVGDRGLKEHASPLDSWGHSRKAAHSLRHMGKALGEGQRMTRL